MNGFKNIICTPDEYRDASVISRESGLEMIQRLEWMTLIPTSIVDAGCGLGESTAALKVRYHTAEIFAFDEDEKLLAAAKNKYADIAFAVCDLTQLPLPSQSVDMVYTNLLIPWRNDIELLLKEWRRVLKPEGVLMLSALGPDTLLELRDNFANYFVPHFIDMHDIGDLLVQHGFADPVLDVNYITLNYNEQEKLQRELQFTDMLLMEANEVWQTMSKQDKWRTTYEMIFAHAFAKGQVREENGTVKIALSDIKKQLASK